jgi:hypothetical protein
VEDDPSQHRMRLQGPHRRAQAIARRRRRQNDDLRRSRREIIWKPDRDLVIVSDGNVLLVYTHDDLAILPGKDAQVTPHRPAAAAAPPFADETERITGGAAGWQDPPDPASEGDERWLPRDPPVAIPGGAIAA